MHPFRRANIIYGAELLAIWAFIFTIRDRMANYLVNIYLHNNDALGALIRGIRKSAVIADATAIFWRPLQSLGGDARMGRLILVMNISDSPTPYLPTPIERMGGGGVRLNNF